MQRLLVFALGLVLNASGCQRAPSPAAVAWNDSAGTSISEQSAAPSLDPTAVLAGTPSCSSRGCHGRLPDVKDAEPVSWSSYSRWLRDDPHAGAYQVLFSPLAQKIGAKLGMAQVAREPRCLACHATPQAFGDSSAAREERLFGVGCESCHGSALKWLEPHKSKSWMGLASGDKAVLQRQLGMNPLGNLRARALVCAGCHVGAPAKAAENLPLRDVDHELIAAGHPRLAFEFGAYLANQPKHWVEKDRSADFEARAWALGQLASAEAALELLIDRAESQRNWPELAENDCFACHHDLDNAAWRRPSSSRALGKLRLNRWYYSLVSLIVDTPFALEPIDLTFAQGAAAGTDTVREAKTLLASLRRAGATIEKSAYSPQSLTRLRTKLASRAAQDKDLGWEDLEQRTLGIKAILASERAALPPGDGGASLTRFDENADALLQKLAFPANAASPLHLRRTPEMEKELLRLFDSLR